MVAATTQDRLQEERNKGNTDYPVAGVDSNRGSPPRLDPKKTVFVGALTA